MIGVVEIPPPASAALRFPGIAARALAFWLALLSGSQAAEDPGFSISPALEVRFPTAPGRVYFVEGSNDAATWTALVGPVFGNGGLHTARLSSRTAPVRFAGYRLRNEDAGTVGIAPASLAGLTLMLNDDGRTESIRLVDLSYAEVTLDGASSFVPYLWAKTGPAAGVLELTSTEELQRIALSFTTSGLGGFHRDEIENDHVEDEDTGAFRLDATPLPGGPASPPPTLTGLTLFLQDAAGSAVYEFQTSASGARLTPGQPDILFSYSWQMQGETAARLTINQRNGLASSWLMDYTTACNGTWTVLAADGTPTPRTGTFTHDGTADNHSTADPNDPCGTWPPHKAPLSLAGRCLSLGSGKTSYCFNGNGTGVRLEKKESGMVEIEPFTYTWTMDCADTGVAEITYPGDDEDEKERLTFDFDSAKYTRQEWDKGWKKGEDPKDFSIGTPSPVAANALRLLDPPVTTP